jgi:enoyl-CoA hydratase
MELKNKNILFRKEERIGIVTLNRPEKLNALNIPLIEEMEEVLGLIREDDGIGVVVLTGAGKAFSVGADIDMLSDLGPTATFRKKMKQLWHRTFGAIEEMDKLFIAALNGHTLGGGLELALTCDLRVAAEGIALGLPEINFGLIPDAGGTIRLARLVGPGIAKELILSGESITSEEAKACGLVNKVFPAHHFLEDALRYAEKFASKSGIAVALGKVAIQKNMNQDIQAGLEDAILIQSVLLKTPEYRESVESFKEKLKKKG